MHGALLQQFIDTERKISQKAFMPKTHHQKQMEYLSSFLKKHSDSNCNIGNHGMFLYKLHSDLKSKPREKNPSVKCKAVQCFVRW